MIKRNRSICVTTEVKGAAASWRVRITAPSVARALELAGDGKPGRKVSVVSPVDLEKFFTGSGRKKILATPGPAKAA